jgi:hypothetical protein
MIALKPIRRALAQIFLLSATLLLGGCFVSKSPLISPDNAVYPFQSITLYEESGGEDGAVTLTRSDDVYLDVSGEDKSEYLLAEIDENLYLAQMRVEDDDDGVSWIYGIVQFQGDKFQILAPLCSDVPEDALNSVGIVKGADENFCTISSLEQLEVLVNFVVGTDIERTTFRIQELIR